MRCTIPQTTLAQILTHVQMALPTRPSLPILSSLLFEVSDSELVVSATDLYFGVQARCAAVVKESGSIAIPGKQVIELLKSLPAGEVSLSTKDNTLEVKTAHITSTLQFVTPEEFPTFPEALGEKSSIQTSVVSDIVKQVAVSCSPDVARPLLTGILWEPGKDSSFVATDGFRLSQWRPGTVWPLNQRLIIPSRFWSEVERIAVQEKNTSVAISYSADQKQITASLENVTIYSRTLEGDYPPYEKIVPTEFAMTVDVQVDELLEQVKRSLLYARDSLGTVQLQFGQTTSLVVAQSSSLGRFEAVLTTAQLKGEDIIIAFNSKYILDFLQLVKTGPMRIGLNGELKPALLSAEKIPGLSYVAMPFRVNQ
ncbi:DNA polymerase III subunit beta [Candidatus Woesebacteria bacterium]|nr:DNA polymerase III subunit beta [Candidatus Woesebacteria bacterium]